MPICVRFCLIASNQKNALQNVCRASYAVNFRNLQNVVQYFLAKVKILSYYIIIQLVAFFGFGFCHNLCRFLGKIEVFDSKNRQISAIFKKSKCHATLRHSCPRSAGTPHLRRTCLSRCLRPPFGHCREPHPPLRIFAPFAPFAQLLSLWLCCRFRCSRAMGDDHLQPRHSLLHDRCYLDTLCSQQVALFAHYRHCRQ